MWMLLSQPGLWRVCVTVTSRAVDRSSEQLTQAGLRTPQIQGLLQLGTVSCHHYKYKTERSWKGSFMFKTELGHVLP